MKLFTAICTFILLVGFQQAYAHGSHASTPITDTAALQLAKETAIQLTQSDAELGFGKLPDSWSQTSDSSVKIFKKGSSYFIVSVANTEEEKTLYVLVSSDGEVYDANFTGKFEGLE